MKALFVKDLQLLERHEIIFISIVCVLALMPLPSVPLIGAFITTGIFLLLPFGLTKDDFSQNNVVYLMALPVTRKSYVRQRFLLLLMEVVFSCILCVFSCEINIFITKLTLSLGMENNLLITLGAAAGRPSVLVAFLILLVFLYL